MNSTERAIAAARKGVLTPEHIRDMALAEYHQPKGTQAHEVERGADGKCKVCLRIAPIRK